MSERAVETDALRREPDYGPWRNPRVPSRVYDHADPACMCAGCRAERWTSCMLTKDCDDHQDHHIPQCPNSGRS